MGEGRLFPYADARRDDRGSGIETVRLGHAPMAGKEFLAGTTSFPPGTSIRLHSHSTVEQVVILEGEGLAELNGEQVAVTAFDTTVIPAGEPHRFINSGATRMTILWIYGGSSVLRTFIDTGETFDQFPEDD
jgi:mannose-6-phosphate isomerase-like protein (cupin superfamily)